MRLGVDGKDREQEEKHNQHGFGTHRGQTKGKGGETSGDHENCLGIFFVLEEFWVDLQAKFAYPDAKGTRHRPCTAKFLL